MAETLLQKAKRLGIEPVGTPISTMSEADRASAERFKPTFPSTSDESVLEGAAKVVGNIPFSAVGFGKSLFDFFNPLNTGKTIAAIPGEAKELVKEAGGVKSAVTATAKELLPETYKAVVPTFLQNLFSGDTEEARRTIENDPVGQILPLIMVGRIAAQKAGKGAEFDAGISKLASPVTKPVAAAAGGVGKIVRGATGFSVSQATGLSRETISRVLENPEEFAKEAQAKVNRKSIADEVQTALSERSEALAETGTEYAPIRRSGQTVSVPANYLETKLGKYAGVDVIKGEIVAKGSSIIRGTSDIRALQSFYNFWKPIFKKGKISADEFLNLRADLAELAKFERQVGKSQPIENMSKLLRSDLNASFRSKIGGLEDLDANFASQISEFNRLKGTFIDREGNLTDAAINRIANATGKGKDLLISRLEEITPGITDKIKILKAVEDIQKLNENIPGRYGRAGLFLGAAYFVNPWAIIGTIISLPELAIPLLRGMGMAADRIGPTLELLGVKLGEINKLPEKIPAIPAALSSKKQ